MAKPFVCFQVVTYGHTSAASGCRGSRISVGSRQAWSTEQVPASLPGLHCQSISEKKGITVSTGQLAF